MHSRFRSLFGVQDLTEGRPLSRLIRFSLPLLLGNFAQQMYSTVDSIVVGRVVGDNGLAAIGATFPIINFLLILFMAISTGTGVIVSQFFGARDHARLNRTIGTTIGLVVASTAIVMAVAIPLAYPILSLVRTPEAIIGMSTAYLQALFTGLLGMSFYNIISGILRGLGDTITPLLVLLLTTVINIVLDIVFVSVLHLGVAGAAWATVIAQFIAAAILLRYLLRLPNMAPLTRADFRPDMGLAAQLMRIGMPSGLTTAIFSLAMISVQALTNSMGPTVVAATTAVMRVDGFAMMPNFTFGMAVMTFVGQNIGAGRMDRVDQGTRDAFFFGLVMSTSLTLLLLIFGPQLIGMFTTTPQIIQLGTYLMRLLSAGYVAMSVMQVYGSVMRGAGDTMPSMWISLFTTVVIRVPLAYSIAYLTRSEEWPHGQPIAMYVSLLTTWVLGALITWLWYRRGKWRNRAVVSAPRDGQDGTADGQLPLHEAAGELALNEPVDIRD